MIGTSSLSNVHAESCARSAAKTNLLQLTRPAMAIRAGTIALHDDVEPLLADYDNSPRPS